MVQLPEGYGIDATEVTRCQYDAWLKTDPPIDGQPTVCSQNNTFVPAASCMSKEGVCTGGDCDDHPAVCVDWCDAYAYCEQAGRRLCGKIGGGPAASEDYAQPSKSQWYAACTSGGVHGYGYGTTNQGDLCNGATMGLNTTVPVGSLKGCQSLEPGYSGVHDLSGNVWEWEDACEGEKCRLRGGSFFPDFAGTDLRCDVNATSPRATHLPIVGFRCCSKP
jgi:formylglycine-generating enzyme required for sulfatase activity